MTGVIVGQDYDEPVLQATSVQTHGNPKAPPSRLGYLEVINSSPNSNSTQQYPPVNSPTTPHDDQRENSALIYGGTPIYPQSPLPQHLIPMKPPTQPFWKKYFIYIIIAAVIIVGVIIGVIIYVVNANRPRPNGEPCSSSSQCVNICYNGLCSSLRYNGDSCGFSMQCVNSCGSGICGGSGAFCRDSSQCISSYSCVNQSCASNSPSPSPSPSPSKSPSPSLRSDGSLGSSCSISSDCLSSYYCGNGVCGGTGALCSLSLECVRTCAGTGHCS